MPMHTKTPEEQYKSAPKMPSDRPATKLECWELCVHLYGGVMDEAKIKEVAQGKWAWSYIYAVNFEQWRKQPDWVEGQKIIPSAVPDGPFPPEKANFVNVNKFWAIAQAELGE
jgi:hypothetical protein